jgi:acyl-coenzyme A synthetase/AMP-(fatty) acid ligase
LRGPGKNIIISGGKNISSIEAEQAITAHLAVLECAAAVMIRLARSGHYALLTKTELALGQ